MPWIIAWKKSGVLACENGSGPAVRTLARTLLISISLPGTGETPTTSIVGSAFYATAAEPNVDDAASIAPRTHAPSFPLLCSHSTIEALTQPRGFPLCNGGAYTRVLSICE